MDDLKGGKRDHTWEHCRWLPFLFYNLFLLFYFVMRYACKFIKNLLDQKPFCYGNHSIIVQTLSSVLNSKALRSNHFSLISFTLVLCTSSLLPWYFVVFYISSYGSHQKLFIARVSTNRNFFFLFFSTFAMDGIKWIVYDVQRLCLYFVHTVRHCGIVLCPV